MEEHGMFVEKDVQDNRRTEHEERLRLAIKVKISKENNTQKSD